MDLSPVKREILAALLLHDEPARAAQLAKEVGKEFPSVMMHLLGLKRMGYASSLEKGTYAVTEKGKEALGLPEVNPEKAASILKRTSREKAFHFYAGIGKPLNLYAHDLPEFCDTIGKVGPESIEFHVKRGDFEVWFTAVGDLELAKKKALLKEKKLSGEELGKKLRGIVEGRCIALSAKREKHLPPA